MKTAFRNTMAGAALTAGLIGIGLVSLSSNAESKPATDGKLNDPTIVAIFDAANTWDIETGKLAIDRGQSKDVREFGEMLARDHKMVRQQGRDLAARLGVTPTPPADFAMGKGSCGSDQEAERTSRRGVRQGLPRPRGGVPQGCPGCTHHDAAAGSPERRSEGAREQGRACIHRSHAEGPKPARRVPEGLGR